MDSDINVVYIDSSLETLYKVRSSYIPRAGNKVYFDDVPYDVINVEASFYTLDCKHNKIRVYLEPSKE